MSFEEPGVPSYPVPWSNLGSDLTKKEKRMSQGQNKIKTGHPHKKTPPY